MRVCGFGLLGCLAFGHSGPPPSLAAQTLHPQNLTHPLITGKHAVVAGLVLAMTVMGDQGLRGEFQEHRGNTTNSVAGMGNALGEPRYLIPGHTTPAFAVASAIADETPDRCPTSPCMKPRRPPRLLG